jgi:predicted aspartyl protease
MTDMGIVRTTIEIASLDRQDQRHMIHDVMVDTGSEYNWIPGEVLESLGIQVKSKERFETADGRELVRDLGWAILHVAGRAAPTVVVFAEPGDMTLLGAVGLEVLNLRVDVMRKQLVPAGPVPVAAAA